MLTSKQRAFLRREAHALSPIFQIGKGGISEEMCLQLGNALEARELIKVKNLENSEYFAKEAAELIADQIGADVVGVVGSVIILYRRSDKKPKIELP